MSALTERDHFSVAGEVEDREWPSLGVSLLVMGFALVFAAGGVVVWLIAELAA